MYIVRAALRRLIPTRHSIMTSIDTTGYDKLTEGSATILFPKNQVFYNPVQQYNRDLSVLAITAFTQLFAEETAAKKAKRKADGEIVVSKEPYAKVMEALSASGLRSIRYAKEIPLVKTCIANDLSQAAVDSIKLNIEYNDIASKVTPNRDDAIKYMAQHSEEFEFVDLDPYGSAAPFIDSAINCLKEGGMMAVTCTDLGVLAGNSYPEKAFALYGGSSMSGDSTHETALRLVLHLVASTAAKYKCAIEPLLSISADFYVRLFIRIHKKPIQVKRLISQTMLTYKCDSCHSVTQQPLGKVVIKNNNERFRHAMATVPGPDCAFCGGCQHLSGPMWSGPLHSHQFIDRILELRKTADPAIYGTLPRIEGMLRVAKSELEEPLAFETSTISKILRLVEPSLRDMTSALGNFGFKASLTHTHRNTIKTDAPWEAIWFIGKQFFKKSGRPVTVFDENSPGYSIMNNDEIGHNIDIAQLKEKDGCSDMDDYEWMVHPNKTSKAVNALRNVKIVRFQENPKKNWGPKARPGI